MARIFISYSHQDSNYTHKLVDALKQRGFDVWIDDRIDYGTRWPRVVQEHLDASAAVIVIMTPRSFGSDWVQNELAYAINQQKPIFPLLLEGGYWFSVAAIQCLDVQNGRLPSSRFYDRLARVVSPGARQPLKPEMILIPAGEFLMGSLRFKDQWAREDEHPQHRLYLPAFCIARTPVTNAQYSIFVQATGHRQPSYWEKGNPLQGKEDHPVVYVSWHDANAYCRWLAEITGKSCNLPSEAEWEKGARGTDGYIYPWGDEWDAALCNAGKGLYGDTTPVDAYPNGASLYDLPDMAGNVWEWTRSLWGTRTGQEDKLVFGYPYDPDDGREDADVGEDVLLVVRGGSFLNNQFGARCACRNKALPDDRRRDRGFRVCVVKYQE